MLKMSPVVFSVGENYQIMVPVTCTTLMWVRVGEKNYYDESNGILRTDVIVHRMTVPKCELDHEKKYTVLVRKLIERKAYFTEAEENTEEYTFDFKPVEGENIRAYHISDTHNSISFAVNAARTFGNIDFLILNGDILNHSDNLENILAVYEIAGEITKGNIPVVFARGNHDMRGVYAEKLCECTPCENGVCYYTFRLGSIWGLILDCGEDKDDLHEAYGYTMCCHEFRKRETEFIKRVIENKKKEYEAIGVEYKMVICHNPFTEQFKSPFDIETDIYTEWTKLLRDFVKPDIMLCGHKHEIAVNRCGGEKDYLGQPCTVVVGAQPIGSPFSEEGVSGFIGAGLEFENSNISLTFTNHEGKIVDVAENI